MKQITLALCLFILLASLTASIVLKRQERPKEARYTILYRDSAGAHFMNSETFQEVAIKDKQ